MNGIEILFWTLISLLGLVYGGYYALCMYVSRSKTHNFKNKLKPKPKVSIVIATWNEERTIGGRLKDLKKLKYPKNKLEIIVIDSGSTDKTRQIVKKFHGIKLITERKRNGKANALNKVFKHCKGDIVIISDSDCRWDKNILMKALPYFNNPSVGAITGREKIINPKENIATGIEKTYRSFFYVLRDGESKIDSTFIFDGPFCAFRRQLIGKIFSDSVADDSELALRVRSKGYRILSIPEAKYYEYAPNKLSDRTKQKYRRAQGLIQIMFRFFSTFFMNPKYGLFGLLIFPVEFFLHVISPFLIVVTIVMIPLLPLNTVFFVIIGMFLAVLIEKSRSFMFTFLHSQYSCLKGMFTYLTKGSSHSWEKVQGTRRYR